MPTRAVDADVSSVTRKTENLSIDNSASQRYKLSKLSRVNDTWWP